MARYPIGMLEEELKNKVAADWFAAYDTTRIIGKVDFCVEIPATELGLFKSGRYSVRAAIRAFLCGEPVARLTGHEFEGVKGVGVIRDAVYESYARVNWKSVNPQLGTVSLTKSGINDSLWHGFGRLKLSAFACVPEIIARGVVVDESRNWKGRGYDSYVIAAPIAIANESYCALVVANQRKEGGFRFYLHEVASIAELKKKDRGFPIWVFGLLRTVQHPRFNEEFSIFDFRRQWGAENDKNGHQLAALKAAMKDLAYGFLKR